MGLEIGGQAPNPANILELRGLSVEYRDGSRRVAAVQDVSFAVGRGETLAIVGESGSGKTSLARALMRLQPVSAGEAYFEGRRVSGKIDRATDRWLTAAMQMIFQDPLSSLNERATVDYIVSEGLYNFRIHKSEADRRGRVLRALSDVGLLAEHADRYPHEFSGGQRQRIGLARVLAMEPRFIIADEPISALDVSIRAQILNLLNRLKRERGLSFIFIAHDLTVVGAFADRVAVMRQGRIQELASCAELFSRPLHPYTRALLAAVPLPDPDFARPRGGSLSRQTADLGPEASPGRLVEIEAGHFVRK